MHALTAVVRFRRSQMRDIGLVVSPCVPVYETTTSTASSDHGHPNLHETSAEMSGYARKHHASRIGGAGSKSIARLLV